MIIFYVYVFFENSQKEYNIVVGEGKIILPALNQKQSGEEMPMRFQSGAQKIVPIVFVVSVLLAFFVLSACAQTIEVGKVSVDENWKTVRLNNYINNPVVVAKPLSYEGGDPAVVRIQNVRSNSFQIRVQEWSYLDDTHTTETVSYLVTRRGSFMLTSGTRVEAGIVETDATGDFKRVGFSTPFRQTPIVFSSVITYNGGETVATRNQNISSSGFEVMMQEQEANEQKHAEERIAYIAIEPGNGTMGGRRFEAGRVSGISSSFQRVKFNFGESTTIKVDEETSEDDEKSHAEETVGYFAVQGGPRYFIADMQTTNGSNTANLRYGGTVESQDQKKEDGSQDRPPSKVAPRGIIIEPPSQPGLDISVRTDRYQYSIGSNLRIFLDVSQRAYVYVFDYDTRGQMRLVFPNRYSRQNLIGPGRYELPDGGYSFRVTGPPGVEFVQAVATTKRIDIGRLLRNPNDPFGQEAYPPIADPKKLNQELKSNLEAKFELQIGGDDPKAQFRISPVSWDSDTTSFRVGEVTQPNDRPVARFSYNPGDPRTGETVWFSAQSSFDPDGSIVSYSWDFNGDGSPDSSGRRVSRRFYSSGRYDVRLTVRDNDGATSSTTQTIRVDRENRTPTARFSYDPGRPEPGERIRFDGSNSSDPDGSLVSYRWDFDGDGFTDAYGRRVSRSFGSSGSYEVALTVVDDDGARASTRSTVRVVTANREPGARFTYSPDRPVPEDSVQFDGSDSADPDGYVTSYRWDFDGDGRTDSYGRRVTHSFGSTGSYTVTLTVVDDDGARSSTSRIVRVERKNQEPYARFSYTPGRPEPEESITFNGSNSYDPDGYLLTHRWDFDGDGDSDSFGSRARHSFNSSGSYEVTLTVIDNDGARSSTSQTIRVIKPQGQFGSKEPDSFSSNGELRDDWYWLENSSHYGEWEWNWISSTPESAFFNFDFLVTNRENGGSGYDATVEVQILDRYGDVIESGNLRLQNPFRPDFSGDTGGAGYEASGAYEVSNPSQLQNGFKVRVEWPPEDSRNLIAVRRASAFLAYTN
mgnify:CR=1 FL=1